VPGFVLLVDSGEMEERESLDQFWQRGLDNDHSAVNALSRAPTITISTSRGGSDQRKSPCVTLDKYYNKARKCYIKEKVRHGFDEELSVESIDESDIDEENRNRDRREGAGGEEERGSGEEEDNDSSHHSNEDGIRGGGGGVINKRKRTNESDSSIEGEEREARVPMRRRYKEGVSECFLCSWGNSYHDGIEAPKINKLTEIIKSNYGKHNNREIAQELHLYFKNEIYDPKRGMVMLTTATALEHIEGLHCLDATIYVGESIKRLKRIDFLLENKIFREDDSYDHQALSDLHKNMALTCRYYSLKIQMMNFSNGNTREDQKGASNYFNLLEPFLDKNKNKQSNKQIYKTQERRAIQL
jgi:hypothetical protein